MTWTSAPLPGAMPRGVGIVASRLLASHGRPAVTAYAPSASKVHDTSGAKPCTTAAASSAVAVGRSPRSVSATRSPSPPTTRTGAPAATRPDTSVATAWAEVTTSDSSAGMPSSVRWAATDAGVRDALFVTKAGRRPARDAAATASAAPGTASGPM